MTEHKQRLLVSSMPDTVRVVMAVREMALRIGMRGAQTSALATAVSELATNIVKYAGRGRVTLCPLPHRRPPGLEVLVEDNGPGIEDVEHALEEHVSTSGTLGLGLPGTRRLVDEFEIESSPGKGTRVRVVKWG